MMQIKKRNKRETRLTKFPGTDQNLVLRSLSKEELRQVLKAAKERFKSKGIQINSVTFEAYEHELTIQTLFMAMRDPEDPEKPFAASADEVRSLLTVSEKDILTREYNEFGVWWDEPLRFQEIKNMRCFGSFQN